MSGPSKVSCCPEVWYIHSFSGVVRFTSASPLCTPAHLPCFTLTFACVARSSVLPARCTASRFLRSCGGGGDMLLSDSVPTEYSHADEVQTLSTTVLFGCYGYDAATFVSSFTCFRPGNNLTYGNTVSCQIYFVVSPICYHIRQILHQ